MQFKNAHPHHTHTHTHTYTYILSTCTYFLFIQRFLISQNKETLNIFQFILIICFICIRLTHVVICVSYPPVRLILYQRNVSVNVNSRRPHLRVKQELINVLPNDINYLSSLHVSEIKVYTSWHKIGNRVLYVSCREWVAWHFRCNTICMKYLTTTTTVIVQQYLKEVIPLCY